MSLSFHSSKKLQAHAEMLPAGLQWKCETMTPEYPTKQPLRLFHQDPIMCLQALLSDPLFGPHISFVLRRIWTTAAKVC